MGALRNTADVKANYQNQGRWAIVLSGGELRSLIRNLHRPPNETSYLFCRSLLDNPQKDG